MEKKTSSISTGVDRLVELVLAKGRISFTEAAKQLGVPRKLVEEWANFLVKRDVIDIRFIFTKPYLIRKSFSKPELEKKKKEFYNAREAFLRTSESFLSTLEIGLKELNEFKARYDKLKQNFEKELKLDKEQFRELEDLVQLRRSIHSKLTSEQHRTAHVIDRLKKELAGYKQQFSNLGQELTEIKQELSNELQESEHIQDRQSRIYHSIENLQKELSALKSKIADSTINIERKKKELRKVEDFATRLERTLEMKKREIEPMLQSLERKKTEIMTKEQELLKKLEDYKPKINKNKLKKLRIEFKKLIKKDEKIDKIISEVSSGFEQLEISAASLVSEAKSIRFADKTSTDEHVASLSKRLEELKKQRVVFENKLKALKLKIAE